MNNNKKIKKFQILQAGPITSFSLKQKLFLVFSTQGRKELHEELLAPRPEPKGNLGTAESKWGKKRQGSGCSST
jgi:hypothetical protein